MENSGKFDPKECVQMTSIDCTSQPQIKALDFLKSNDIRGFTDIINTEDVENNGKEKDHWINLQTDDAGATLMEVAILLGRHQFIEQMIKAGARVDIVSHASGLTPAHLAVEKMNATLLKLLLSDDDNADVNVKSADFKQAITPLHLAAEKGATECIKILLKFEYIDVDAKDGRGVQTPLLMAIKGKHEEAVRLLIEHGASLDTKAGRATLREYIRESFPSMDPSKITVKQSRGVMNNLGDKMFTLLKETELDHSDYASKLSTFKTYMHFIRNIQEQRQMDQAFDIACKKGLHEHVELMVSKGASPNTAGNPILEAAFYGHHKVIKVLVKNNVNMLVTTITKETALHLILKMQNDSGIFQNYEKCFEEITNKSNSSITSEQVRLIVNKKDDRSNTALHYATQKWPESVVRTLLELGANIGIKNHWQEVPISKIRPDTMENFLSEFCLNSEGDIVHENFSLTFKYDFLAPSPDSMPDTYSYTSLLNLGVEQQNLIKVQEMQENSEDSSSQNHPLPETEPLWYMSQSKEHRHLLKHPVITSFLWLKWQRIRRYFNRNLRFFTLFVYLLTWYIFLTWGGDEKQQLSDAGWHTSFIILVIIMIGFILKDWVNEVKNYQMSNKSGDKKLSCFLNVFLSCWVESIFLAVCVALIVLGSSIIKITLWCLLVLIFLRELLQMCVSIKRFFCSIDNWIEMSLIALVSILLLGDGSNFELNRHLAAISIVLSWAMLIVLIGQHPKLKEYNIYVTMFLKVLKTFIFFFTWYSLFIVAFGLGFFILLHKDSSIPSSGDDGYAYFNQVWLSLVKTTTMFVGELEFSDIPISLESQFAPIAYLFFLSFIFLIVVVLMNLLNGLAVSDTGLIREKAEIFSYRSQVETISTFESMLLGDPFDFLSNVPALLTSLPSCSILRQVYRHKTIRRVFTFLGASEILLFYKFLPEKSITMRPNERDDQLCCLRTDEIGRSIVASAKEIIIRQQTELREKKTDISDKVDSLQKQVGNLEKKMELILKKLDAM